MNDLQIIESELADILLDRNILPLGKLRLFIVSYIRKHNIDYRVLDIPNVPQIPSHFEHLLKIPKNQIESKLERELLLILIVDILERQIELKTWEITHKINKNTIESGVLRCESNTDVEATRKIVKKTILQYCFDDLNLFVKNINNLDLYYIAVNNTYVYNVDMFDFIKNKPKPQTIKESWHVKNGQPTKLSDKPKSSKCLINRFFNWLLK